MWVAILLVVALFCCFIPNRSRHIKNRWYAPGKPGVKWHKNTPQYAIDKIKRSELLCDMVTKAEGCITLAVLTNTDVPEKGAMRTCYLIAIALALSGVPPDTAIELAAHHTSLVEYLGPNRMNGIVTLIQNMYIYEKALYNLDPDASALCSVFQALK